MVVKFLPGFSRPQIETFLSAYGARAIDYVPRIADGDLVLARFEFPAACANARCDGRPTAANLVGLGLLINASDDTRFSEPNWYIEVRAVPRRASRGGPLAR
jgi:hypothetical protein